MQRVMQRRRFLRTGAATVVAAAAPRWLRAAAPARRIFTALGVATSLQRAAEVKECGADYLLESTTGFLMPDEPEAKFEESLAVAVTSPLPVLGTNGFLRHPRLRCTGPDADHPAVLAFADIAFRRLQRAGGRLIVFGSAGARRIPAGYPKEKADEQFTALLRAMAPLAAARGVTVAIELLRAQECNYLTRLGEVAAIIAAVDHPNVRALADFYHMAVMGDTPADLARALPLIGMLEIAEQETRSAPGVAGDDFRPWFRELARAGYSGPMTIEGRWDLPQLRAAFAEIRRQEADALSA